ncbi:lycopene cyclase domain-containing protein [Acidobacterium sp. S8]|uniref:lycopene cyclase domain-containing protein n=1 Tax=Acidobacterium sp. S8 TaxID=1641854 RepID=UPI00131B40C5|nr:lycopene cyclase domain-containing protein [Acidobacterium sp. S8]
MRKSPPSPRASFWLVLAMFGLIAAPAAITLHTVRGPAPAPTPYGYTVSLLLFILPVFIIAFWFFPQEEIRVSQKAFWWTIGLLFPLGAGLDFFFARYFFYFPNAGATLGIRASALGGGVPVEEYIFYFAGFLAILLLYIWLDAYWLDAYSVPDNDANRINFERLFRFHPQSVTLAIFLVLAGILYKRNFGGPGFPGYFTFLVLGALLPSSLFLPTARPVINWRAFSLTMFMVVLISLLWEVTLALPYGWWNFRDEQMLGVRITAWSRLPIEEVFLWVAVTYATVIVYEIVRRWKASGKKLWHALSGRRSAA